EITTLTDDEIMKLDFSVPSVYLSSLTKGLKVLAKSQAFPEHSFSGVVTGIDSKIDPVTRAILVRAEIPNPDRLLKPGLLMTVQVQYNPRKALIVPEEALVPADSKNFVFEVNEKSNEVTQVEIKIGTRAPGKVEVLSGLQAGQLVITHGTMAARPGTPVVVSAIQAMGEGIEDVLKRKAKS
ncbi:MAG: efflux RND transporter periplasmic adaptor subunit, partial [Bdellovibrionales bacterium]|nr:efflux RND transporter periplasmic adaptor subunit [Bdellovibrionales bacterium]